MLEIALDNSENGVFQKDIADRQSISVKYLDNIIASLKTAGLIINKKGKKSGYRLSRKPAEIKVLDIYEAFEPGICVVDCISDNFICDRSEKCGVKNFWSGLNKSIIAYFEAYTLEDLITEHRNKAVAGLLPGLVST
jgi:Rrf2 family protein